jgi:hypothetical protein
MMALTRLVFRCIFAVVFFVFAIPVLAGISLVAMAVDRRLFGSLFDS